MRVISTLQTFQSLQHSLELQQWMVFDIETKKLLIRRNSRLALNVLTLKSVLMRLIPDKSGSLPVIAGELVCFKQPFGNFQGKHLLGSSVSVKFHVIRRTELEKSTCKWLLQKLGVFEGLFLVRLSFYVSCKALVLILLSNE